MINSTKHIRLRKSQGWKDKPFVCLSISCGKEYHEGDSLGAAIALAFQADAPVLIDLSDTLQRHNLIAQGLSPEDAMAKAAKRGDEWLNRNRFFLSGTQVIRWDHWLFHENFKAIENKLIELDKTDAFFSSMVTKDVEKFVQRQQNPSPLEEQSSRNFILEEAAGEILLGREYPCSRLYPGNELNTLRAIRTLMVPEAPNGLEQTAYYKFTIETRGLFVNAPSYDCTHATSA